MRLVFGVLAALLFVIGAALFIGAINLIPTDLGLVYLQGGITVITGGAIILAIGFSAPKPRSSLTRKATSQQKLGEAGKGSKRVSLPEAGSPLNQPIASPASAIEPTLETQRDSLMAAFERDLGSDLATELEKPQSAQEQSAEENTPTPPNFGITDARFDHFVEYPERQHPERAASSPLERESMDFQEAEPARVKQEAVNRFELPALDMTISAPAKETLGDISHPQRGFEPHLEHQEHRSAFPMRADEPPTQTPPENIWGEPLVSPENTPFIEEASPQLAPLSELDVVGSYESAGTRFTMYSDGSVVTAGAEGEQRFLSLDALRAFLAAKA